ncbi:insulin receptor substrate 2-A [Stigmatopora nigra]
MRPRMANLLDYQEGKAAMLVLEAQQRNVGSQSASGEAPSPVVNISGGGGSRPHQLPPSYHVHHFEPQFQYDLASLQLCADPGEDTPGGKTSSSPLVEPGPAPPPQPAAVFAANPTDDVRKCGYLRKQKHGHKRFFVLRASSHLGPSRLEYYDSEKKFRGVPRAGSVGPSSPKRVIYLYQCFTVNKRADSKNKHLIALYTKDEYFAMVAENERDQEDWYIAVGQLMSEGRKGHPIADDLDDGYGTVTPGTVFKEVWNVNVKPKGLGQTKNLAGLYRLCLSSKTLHLVKLNSDTPCFNQHLMNIRRCGHSESFFFIEVGRFSSTGPGELWMQVDDSVVAQKMHETILDTMKALKAFAELRPRSKSQSSGSNPVAFVTTRRHLSNLPPSQTGLQRRSRMESLVGTPPSSKSNAAYRFRTSSEGEGTMNRPFRSATGSLLQLGAARSHHNRGEGVPTGVPVGRGARAVPASHSARSASLPMSHFPSATSPVSVSSSSGHGSVSDTLTRPSSASICGSPSDGGFNSSDEYGSSPGDFRYFRVRSNTPDSLGNTPPIREENCLSDYMAVGWNRDPAGAAAETTRDESTSTTEDERWTSSWQRRRRAPVNPKVTPTHFSLEEGADAATTSGVRRTTAPPRAESSGGERPPLSAPKEDAGYVPMMCGVATPPRDAPPDYVPMQAGFHHVAHPLVYHSPTSAPRSAQRQSTADPHGYVMMLPGCGAGSPSPVRASHGRAQNGEYMDMASGGGRRPDVGVGSSSAAWRSFSPYFSLPRSYKAPSRDEKDYDDYVPMSSPAGPERRGAPVPPHPPPPYGAHHATADSRVSRPDRLPLGRRSVHAPSTSAPADRPPSPGEYINIDFGDHYPRQQQPPPYALSTQDEEAPPTPREERRTPPLPRSGPDYMSMETGRHHRESDELPSKSVSPRPSLVAPWNPPSYIRPLASNPGAPVGGRWRSPADDYTDMTFSEGQRTHAVLRHLCDASAGSPTLPPGTPEKVPEPKVIRADPQGRRRHSSETFSSASSSGSTPSANPPTPAAPNASPPFDGVWMSVKSHGDPQGTPAAPRMYAGEPSAGYQNGLNYIALEPKSSDAGVSTGVRQSAALPENQAYAGLGCPKSDAPTTKD